MKKLMLLGGTSVLVPVIECAHRLGIYVITCDYSPNNYAHQYSDKYINASTMDQETILEKAREENIDGIMSFACDSGVISAAYVAEQMNLPFQCSYEVAKILQDKGLFRQFLRDHGFNCPKSKRYDSLEEVYDDMDIFAWPVIVKPVDSAGSKCVTKAENKTQLKCAAKEAFEGSHKGAIIIEDFLTFEGYHSSTDPFTVDGKLKFATYSDQLFDEKASNPYTPALIIWPSTMKQEHQDKLTEDIQRLMDLLHMRTGIYNIETCVSSGKPYIMEVSPRGGGCKIAELQNLAYGVNLIEYEIKKAVGLPINEITQSECDGCWCEVVIHSDSTTGGRLDKIMIDEEISNKYIRLISISAKENDIIEPFSGGNKALGDMIMHFADRDTLNSVIHSMDEWLHIILKENK